MKDAQRPPSRGSRDFGDLSWDEGERLSEQQQRLHPIIDRINVWAERHPEVFAGVCLDNSGLLEGTGSVRVGLGFADADVHEVQAMVGPLVDDPTKLVLVRKQLPVSVRRRAQHRVVCGHMHGHGHDGASVSECGVDLEADALEGPHLPDVRRPHVPSRVDRRLRARADPREKGGTYLRSSDRGGAATTN